MRRTLVTCCLFFIITTLPAFAGGPQVVGTSDSPSFVIPEKSPVSFDSIDKYGAAHFKGRFTLSGKYRYGFLVDPNTVNPTKADLTDGVDPTLGLLEFSFVPDLHQRIRLPYWERDNRVHEITFSNEKELIATLISPSAMQALLARSTLSVSGKVSIVVENYEASVECDYATYTTTFISIKSAPTEKLARITVDQDGC